MSISLRPAAVSLAAFHTNMPSVIDSLKRLERIGSEESETVRKILEAADQVGHKIVESLPPGLLGEPFRGFLDNSGAPHLAHVAEAGNDEGSTALIVVGTLGTVQEIAIAGNFKYTFGSYLCTPGGLEVRNVAGNFVPVGSDRESALAFSKDIAMGLLDLVALLKRLYLDRAAARQVAESEAASARRVEMERALATLNDANQRKLM